MTTLQMQFAPHFQAPVTEDPMELTSDTDQRAGASDDIDIDLDLTGDIPQDGEDEFMGEEDMNALADSTSVNGQESHAVNDDEMADDSYAQGQVDEGSSVRDEDIEDVEYTAPDLDEDTIVESHIDLPNEQSERLSANYEQIVGDQNHEQDYQEQEYNEQEHHEQEHHEQEHHEQEHHEQEHHEHPTTPETESGIIERALPNGQMGLVNPRHDVAKVATREISDEYDFEVSKEATVNHGGANQTSEHSDVEGLIAQEAKLEQVGEKVLPASLDQGTVAQLNVEGSQTQEEESLNGPAPLHPVLLDYQGDEMFLFPPVDQTGDHAATFLLTDEQLAYSSIGDLLEACRGVLKGSLSEQDELMIHIIDLDLHISESTIESASTRLSEVIDLYVRLQQNDGLENPQPLYMDLTSRNRFSCRLDLLRNALTEGKGLSQLESSQESDNNQHHQTEVETDPSSHNAVLSNNETYASEQQPGEEVEESMDHYDSHSNPLPSENLLLETNSATQGTQSYPITDVAHEEDNRTEAQPSSSTNPHEAGSSGDFFSEAAGSKEFLGPAQPLAGESELQKAEGSIVDDGDYIDYEDEELEGGTSSASSTLQGDAINVNAVQDYAAPEEPIIAQNQEHRSPHNVQDNTVADEETFHDFADEKVPGDVGVPVEQIQPSLAEVLYQDSDDNGRDLSGQFDEEGEAPQNDPNASFSQETELPPKVNANDQQHEASAQYKDDAGSDRHDTLHEHADQTEGYAYIIADTIFDGEIEGHSSTRPFQSESSRSGRSVRDNDMGKAKNSEADSGLEEAGRSLAHEDNGDVPRPPEGVNTRPSLFVDKSAQTREDDDEITYEDEEDDTDFPHEPAKAEDNVAASPGSLKRARSLHEDDDAQEEDLQGAKRVRSG